MNFLAKLEDLVSRQERLDEIIFDPITRCRAEPPYLLCSDGRIYAASSLREWARTCMSDTGMIRSLMDHTYLKPRAENVTDRVVAAARAVGIEIDDSSKEGLGLHTSNMYPWIHKREVDIIDDVVGGAPERKGPARTDVLEWRVNIASKLKSDLASAICVLAGLEEVEDIRIECTTRRESDGRITLLTPPPDSNLRDAFIALADEMGIGVRGITNPEGVGTAILHAENEGGGGDGDNTRKRGRTLEERLLANYNRGKRDEIIRELWGTIIMNN